MIVKNKIKNVNMKI